MATAAMMIKAADNTRSHSLLIAIAASTVPKTGMAAIAMPTISALVCGGVLAKNMNPRVARIFRKTDVTEMSWSFMRSHCTP